MICATTENHADVYDLFYWQLPQAGKLLLQWLQWLQTHDYEWQTMSASVTTSPNTPHTHTTKKRQSPDMELLKIVFKICDKEAEVWVFTDNGSLERASGELSYL